MKPNAHNVLPPVTKILLLIAAVGLLVLNVLLTGAEDEQPTAGDVIGQIEASAQVLTGHQVAITDVRFSPDGAYLASSDGSGVIRLWEAADGALVRFNRVHSGPVMDIAFNPDSTILASASMDGSARMWTFGQNERIDVLNSDEPLLSVRFSPNGNLLAVGGRDGTLFLWDITSGTNRPTLTATLTGHTEGITALAFSPDGTLLASTSFDGTVRLWDSITPAERAILKPEASYKISQMDVVFSPDGAYLFTSDGLFEGSLVRQWEIASGVQTTAFLTDTPTNSIALSPDGRFLAAGVPEVVQLWGVATGEQIAQLQGHDRGSIKGMAFSPDGVTLASASEDRTIRLWNVGLLLRPQPSQGTATPFSTPERDPLPALPTVSP